MRRAFGPGRTFLALVSLVAIVAAVTGCSRPQEAAHQASASPGAAAPDFRLQDVGGATVHLSGLRGKVVVLEFWATWCPPCRAAVPELADLHRRFSGRGVAVLGISVDSGNNLSEKLAAFSSAHVIPYPVLIGTEEVAERYGVRSIPATFVIDRAGVIVRTFPGYSESYGKAVGSLIEELI